MKLVSGRTLGDLITDLHDDGFPSEGLEQLLRVILKVCEAVAFAHSRGVVHRDLKPANIMIGTHGQVYVMDWGLGLLLDEQRQDEAARRAGQSIRTSSADSRSGPSLAGTVCYMAPEQAAGQLDKIGPHTDVFAIGAILYELLTGSPPYEVTDLYEALSLARAARIPPPQERAGPQQLPPGLCEIAMRALEREPARRHGSAGELREDLEAFLRGGGWFATRRYEKDARIIEEGGPADSAFVIVDGRCQVIRERSGGPEILRALEPGDVFGETALLSAQPRTATVVALEDVTVKVITAEAFGRELDRSSWLAALVKQLSARFLELEKRLSER
jgi:serine/threonine-protein kinase